MLIGFDMIMGSDKRSKKKNDTSLNGLILDIKRVYKELVVV